MSKVKIRIDLDRGFTWRPITEVDRDQEELAMGGEADLIHPLRCNMTLEVDQTLIDQYKAADLLMRPIQEALENLYRVQQGLTPFSSSPLVSHTIVRQEVK